jgi:methionyl-tRNA formyltransferase
MAQPSRIMLLCATRRGVMFLRRLVALCPAADITVVTFPPEPWEPDYLTEIEVEAERAGARLVVERRVERASHLLNDAPDLLLAVSWRYLVPREVRERVRLGAYVFHDSLLPKYRGFSPTPWAIIEGEAATGVSLIEMADVVDGGRLVAQERVDIGPEDFIAAVLDRVTNAYLRVLEHALPDLLAGTARLVPQNEEAASWRPRRKPEDNVIDWSCSARRVFNLIRACAVPYPGAFFWHAGRQVKVWVCDPPSPGLGGTQAHAGQVVEVVPGAGARVLAGDGQSLFLRTVQVGSDDACTADFVFREVGAKVG